MSANLNTIDPLIGPSDRSPAMASILEHEKTFQEQITNSRFCRILREFPCNTAPVGVIIHLTTVRALKITFMAMKDQLEWRASTLDGIAERRAHVSALIGSLHALTYMDLKSIVRGGEFTGQNVVISKQVRMMFCLNEMMSFAGRISGIPGINQMREVLEGVLEDASFVVLDKLMRDKQSRRLMNGRAM